MLGLLGELAKAIFLGSRRLAITFEAVGSVPDSRRQMPILILTLLTAEGKSVVYKDSRDSLAAASNVRTTCIAPQYLV